LVHAEARRRGGREIVDDAAQALYQGVSSEVEEQAHALVHEPKIGQKRLPVDGGKPFD
jgi:hypothetical protein